MATSISRSFGSADRARATWSRRATTGLACLALSASVAAGCFASRPAPAGENVDDACRRIDKVVEDPARAATLRQVIAEVGALGDERLADNRRYREAWRRLNADYDAPIEAFRALDREQEDRRQGQRERFLALQEKFASSVSDEEWERLGDARPASMLAKTLETSETERR